MSKIIGSKFFELNSMKRFLSHGVNDQDFMFVHLEVNRVLNTTA